MGAIDRDLIMNYGQCCRKYLATGLPVWPHTVPRRGQLHPNLAGMFRAGSLRSIALTFNTVRSICKTFQISKVCRKNSAQSYTHCCI